MLLHTLHTDNLPCFFSNMHNQYIKPTINMRVLQNKSRIYMLSKLL